MTMEIKRFSLHRLAVMLLSAMIILPQSAKADDFTPDLFPGQSPDRTELEISATVKVGDYGKAPNTQSYVTDLASTNEEVVRTFNESGHTVVLVVGVGTADVTYTEQMFSLGDNGTVIPEGDPTHHIIHYTVEKGEAVGISEGREGPLYDFRLVWEKGQTNYMFLPSAPSPQIRIMQVYLRQRKYPEMTFKYLNANEMQWESSNPEVATVESSRITPVSYGKTTIRASWPGDDNWIGTSVEYNLTVEPEKQNIYINFYQTEITGFAGEQMTAPMNVQMLTIDHWLSERPEVASVDEKTGTVKFHTVGTTRIFAQIDETDEHYAAQGYYTVTVKKRSPELSFSPQEAYGEPNVPFTAPTLINPSNVPIDKWYSSNPNVAEVNETTGEVTIKDVGDASIFCEFTGNDTYEAATASYIIHSATIGLQVMGIEVTSLNADDVLGDGSKKVTFDKDSRKLNLNGWVLDASGVGDPNIRTRVIWNHSKEPLTINPTGECAIRNADGCIVSMSGALVFMSDSKDGTLTLTANETTQSMAVQAGAVKVHDCDVTAIGSVVGMKISELTVSGKSHIYAEATGTNAYAGLKCSKFNIADENLHILTPGVHYDNSKQEFFDDEANTVRSKVVEIGESAAKQKVTISFSEAQVTGIVGDVLAAPTPVITPSDLGLTIDHWTAENPKVAAVDEKTGQVTLLAGGSTKIYAAIDETEEHFSAQGYYTVYVMKQDPKLSFSQTEVNGEVGAPFTPPTLVNTYEVPISKWSSNNPKVAMVNETTGEVTLMAPGDATITCEVFETETHIASSASYLVHVTSIGLIVRGIYVTTQNCNDVLGDGQKKVTFDQKTRTLNLNEWVFDASVMSAEFRKDVIVDEAGPELTINLAGDCSITNAQRCVVADKGAVVFLSETKTGTLALTANDGDDARAIQALEVKFHECDVTATGVVVAMKLAQGLTVTSSAHVYAEATGEKGFAIQCSEFVKGDENVGILTPGVQYDESVHQFFSDEAKKVQAKVVEIGKVLVTVPDDEETSIEFNVTDASDHSAVVFSTSANDSYNEETGQLEISTALTDEQVAAALETLIPGSSAWVSMLPGSLTFDIPAGKGSILVNCMTLPGYTLNIMIEGQGTVSITQASLGWAKVTYDIVEPTHVVIYLHASSSYAPARRAQEMAGAFISAVKIIPENAPDAIDVVKAAKSLGDGKYLQNGQLYIVRDGRVYNAQGIEVKSEK